ncbi:MAG: MFS transporter [Pseudomonadota bacterium]
MSATQPLPRRTLFYYSLTDLPLLMALFPVLVFIPKYYGSNLGIPLALIGNIMLFTRLLDVVTDPLVGYLSDHTQSRFGRRKPWIVAAAPLLMVSFYKLFVPPDDAGALYLFTWMALMWLGMTMILIPYYAWAAELSPDFHERSRITGWRSMAGTSGQLLAQLMPLVVAVVLGLAGTEWVLTVVAWTMLIVLPICVTLTVTQVPTGPVEASSSIPMLQGLKLMGSNGPFKRLVLGFMIGQTALAMTTPLYLFFITYVLHAEDQAIKMLTCFYLANLASVQIWVRISHHIGKHIAYMLSFIIIALAHPFYLLLGEGDFWWMLPITLVTGFAAGAFAALPNSMKADVIDLDTLESGENRAALFFATWSFTMKAAAALGSWLAVFGLSLWGFDATLGAENTPEQLFGVRFLFALAPSVFFLTAAYIIWRYPITEEVHAQMRSRLEARTS